MNNPDSASNANAEQERPDGAILHAQFDGILEGYVGDRVEVEAAVNQINAVGIVEADLEFDGGKFTILFDNAPIPGDRATIEKQQQLLELLAKLIGATPSPETVESTLACKVVHDNGVVETVLAVQNGTLRPLSRVRDRDGRDARSLEHSEHFTAPLGHLGFKKGGLVALLLLLAFGLMAWQSGYVQKILSRPADQLKHDLGPFKGLVDVSVEKSWGSYLVTIQRGPSYPKDAEEADQLRLARKSLGERAALDIVTKGNNLYVQLCNEEGGSVESEKAELRPLLNDKNGKVPVRLPGRLDGHSIRLALDRGKAKKD